MCLRHVDTLIVLIVWRPRAGERSGQRRADGGRRRVCAAVRVSTADRRLIGLLACSLAGDGSRMTIVASLLRNVQQTSRYTRDQLTCHVELV